MHPHLKVGVSVVVLCVAAPNVRALSRGEAVKLALEMNPTVAVGQARWRAAEARVRQISSPPRPELELEYEGLTGAFDLGGFEERSVAVTQRIPSPLAWWQQRSAARKAAEGVRFSALETTRTDVAFAVREAYDAVLADERLRALAETHVGLARELVDRAQTRLETGDAGRLDVVRAEVAARRLENARTSATAAARRSRGRLNVLLGHAPDAPLTLTDSLVCRPAHLDLATLTGRALRARAELRATDLDWKSARSQHAAAYSSVFPDISLSVARQTVRGPGGSGTFWRTGIALDLPLWAFADPGGRIAEASAEANRAEALWEATRLRVMEEVHAAYLRYQASAETLARTADDVYPAARSALEIARRSYDAGKATALDFLAAQRDLVSVEVELVRSQLAFRSAESALMHAVGEDPLLGPVVDGRNGDRTANTDTRER